MIQKRIFAIGLKHWVEVRMASTPPAKKVSQFKLKPRGAVFKLTVYDGGKVLGAFNRVRFNYYVCNVPHGDMLELTAHPLGKQLVKASYRRRLKGSV